MKIVIIDYGAGNIQSVKFAIERLGYKAILSKDKDEITQADKVIFPGVGQASSAMKKLKESGLDQVIPLLKQPVLGICLGMQLLCRFSEEGQTEGLNIFDVEVKRFSNKLKVPQMGWNTIVNLKSNLFSEIESDSYMYLVHSYFVPLCKDTIAQSSYDIDYSTAIKKNNFYGVQFHPEKSSKAGAQLLKNFIEL